MSIGGSGNPWFQSDGDDYSPPVSRRAWGYEESGQDEDCPFLREQAKRLDRLRKERAARSYGHPFFDTAPKWHPYKEENAGRNYATAYNSAFQSDTDSPRGPALHDKYAGTRSHKYLMRGGEKGVEANKVLWQEQAPFVGKKQMKDVAASRSVLGEIAFGWKQAKPRADPEAAGVPFWHSRQRGVRCFAYSPACRSIVDREAFNTDLNPWRETVDADTYYKGMAGQPVRPGIISRKPRAQSNGARLAHGHDMEEIVMQVDHSKLQQTAALQDGLLRACYEGRHGRPPWNPQKGGSGVCFHAFYTTPGKKDFELYTTKIHDPDADFKKGRRLSNTFPQYSSKKFHHIEQMKKATFDSVVHGRDIDASGVKLQDEKFQQAYKGSAGLHSEALGRKEIILTMGKCHEVQAPCHTPWSAASTAAASSPVLLDNSSASASVLLDSSLSVD